MPAANPLSVMCKSGTLSLYGDSRWCVEAHKLLDFACSAAMARALHVRWPLWLRSRWRVITLVFAAGLALAYTATTLAPPLAHSLALGGALAVLICIFLIRNRRRPALRSENELIAALGAPLLAARPFAPQGLSQQLITHWFVRGRAVLAVVSPENGDGRTRVAAELARAFARMGEPTLLIDGDFRSPGLHREFGLRNRAGLGDWLEGRSVQLAHCAENLSVLVAGRCGADPLELLSRKRLQDLLAAAAKRYRVVLVNTPAAARGPDLQMFAAFAGGALVVTKRPARAAALGCLRDLLAGCKARVVGTVLSSV